MRNIFLIGLVLALAGCDRGSATESDTTPPPPTGSASDVQLANLLPAGAVLVGVTITPDGKRYVLDQRSGLYELGESSASLVFNTSGLNGVELTDVVALDNDRFALTAENDGFLYDKRTQAFESYFCYLPSAPPNDPMPGGGGSSAGAGGSPTQPVTPPISISQSLELNGIAVKQRTESVAFNTGTRQLFAQPRTTRLDNGSMAGSELFVFNEGGGQPIQVLPFVDTSFVAGGMVSAPGNRLLLGAKNVVYEVTLDGSFTPRLTLEAGVDISGMAASPNGTLWLLDSASQRLLKLDRNL
jgi:hypothetical protein